MTTAAQTASPRSTADAEPELSAAVPLHRDYFARLFSTPPVVCGRQLLPLSIGRYRLLHRFQCAFVADGPTEATAGDLLIGVLVCSMRVDDFMAFAAAPDFSRQLRRWSSRFGFLPPRSFSWPIIGRILTRCFGNITAEVDARKLLGEIEKFRRYITESQQTPRYWDETSGGIASASHWSQSIEAALREFQGWSREEINEEPLAKALWDYFKHCESRGLIRLLSDEETAEIEAPEDETQTAAWLEYARIIELARAG